MHFNWTYKNEMVTKLIYIATCPPWLAKILIFVIAYFTPIREMIHVMLIFLAVDFISGVWAARKEKKIIESIKLRHTVYKFIWYTVAVMVSWMMETTFKLGWTNLASIVAGFICFVELKSIFENITRITNEQVFKRISKMIQKKGSEIIKKIGDDPDSKDNPTK